jgi:membrane-bound lytic murein transglycosylase F
MLTGEFRVATRNGPTTFYHGPDEPRGIDYELAKGYADYLGVELTMYVADQFQDIFPDIDSGKAHIGAAGLSVTEARREVVEFGPSYQRIKQQVIYRIGTRRPYELKDLLQGRLEVLAGSAYVSLLQEAREETPELTWIENPENNIEELVQRVEAGEIDYTIVDSNEFELLRHSHPDARTAFSIGPETFIAWALPKTSDSSLYESVSTYFQTLRETGGLQEILDHYSFLRDDDFNYVGSRAFIRHFHSRLPAYKDLFIEAGLSSNTDWRLLAAMAYQESHWDPKAVSPTGVRGMMMLTKPTARMIGVKDRTNAPESILGGSIYLKRVMAKIPVRIPEPDRTWLAVAAYNVGFGHVEDARIITESQGANPDSWIDVRERLPLLSDPGWYEHLARGYAKGSEPVLYVNNVRRYFELLKWMTAEEELVQERPFESGQTDEINAG